jgi:hypothetical protein
MTYSRLLYVKRSELIRRESLSQGQPNRYCRVMAYNETHGMLVVSQVSKYLKTHQLILQKEFFLSTLASLASLINQRAQFCIK